MGPPVAPGYLNTRQLIENARWLPYLNWAGRTDELVPIGLVRAQQQRFDELGLRSQLWTYPGGHLDLAAGDRWEAARAFLAAPVVQPDPRRVDYVFVPGADNRRLGLVHDHAYWVSGLRARGGERGAISAVSSAPPPGPGRAGGPFGRAGDPVLERVTAWDGRGRRSRRASRAPSGTGSRASRGRTGCGCGSRTFAAPASTDARAGLTGRRCLRVTIEGDGPARVALALRLPRGARARRGAGCNATAAAPEVALGRRGATFRTGSGARSWVILPE